MVGRIIVVGLSLAQPAQSPAPPAPPQSACAQASAEALVDGAASEICAGDQALRLANAVAKDSADRPRQLTAAAGHFRKAAIAASTPARKILALNLLVDTLDAQHLDDAEGMETALREIIALAPDDLAPVFRLAKLQEDEGHIDAAEQTLLDARHRQPDVVDPARMLAQFYARLASALHKQTARKEPQAPGNPGERDANGVYRVGGAVPPPSRLGVPQYPPEAQAAGLKGVVVVEVVIDANGAVTEPKVVQSIPLLDEAAIKAVREWQFVPTVVNGQPVPVRMNLSVNFSLPR